MSTASNAANGTAASRQSVVPPRSDLDESDSRPCDPRPPDSRPPDPELGFALSSVARGHLLALAGRLDVHAAADVRLALADAVDEGLGDLVLDLSGVAAVDATGLGVLVGAHRRAGRAGRTLVLRDVPEPVGRMLRRTRLDRVLHRDGLSA